MRRLAVCIALVACKDSAPKQQPPTKVVLADAAIDAAADWTAACEAALTTKQTAVRRLSMIIANCQPCGDWTPLIDWNTQMTDGGPPEATIEAMMVACNAYCSKDSKMQFMGALPDARGKLTNKPWRVLGEKCGDKVSAVPDVRFMSAPFFALDRIARATAAHPKLGPLAAAVELPLPPVSMTGVGFELPVAAVMNPDVPKFQVTVTQSEIRIGKMPTAKLTANGVIVDLGPSPYPGELVDVKSLAQKLGALTTDRILLIAPRALPASRVTEVVKALGKREIVLAVGAAGSPKGWSMPGVVPVLLNATPNPKSFEWTLDSEVEAAIANLKQNPAEAFVEPRITVAKTATVEHLAKLLGALAFRDAPTASLTNALK
ncbi:MAG: hypothetical protein H0T65_27190 [Deltaproteobacteria bacterium]|nr:hypothetical protein [Deltaproteobacteria bacterium]